MFNITNELMSKIKEVLDNTMSIAVPQVAEGPVMFACTGCSGSCSNTCTGSCRTGCASTCKASSSSRW